MASTGMGRVGKRGTVVIPVTLRRRYGLAEGTLLIAEERPEGILLRPAVAIPTEAYTPERRAAFVLENAIDWADYAAARKAVIEMGLDPDQVPHNPPEEAEPPAKSRKRSRK